MKWIKTYKLFESQKDHTNNSPLLNLENNVDNHLMSIIQENLQIGSNILEVSCGNAADSLYLKEIGYNVKCTEFDDSYVKNANDLGLECIKHDTRMRFPYSDNQFDLVYSRLGLHYFTEEELDSIFSELSRIGDGLLITVKIEEDFYKTGKIILSPEKWFEIINKYYNIEIFDVKEGLLYDKKSKWIEILANK
jgi:SAM-dependent methyltransferase